MPSTRDDLVEILRECRDWLLKKWQAFWLSRGRGTLHYKDTPAYQAAVEFRKKFTPVKDPECKYQWVVEYAKTTYETLHDSFDKLDDKADAIIKYLGGGSALIVLGAIATVRSDNAWLVLLLLPSLICAIRAINLAIQARSPMDFPLPPPVTKAIEYVEEYKEAAEATFISSWHESIEGLDVVREQKAKLVARASAAYYHAVVLLLIPLVVWPAHKAYQAYRGQSAPDPTRVEIVAPVKIEPAK
jgi:hypothetical protein